MRKKESSFVDEKLKGSNSFIRKNLYSEACVSMKKGPLTRYPCNHYTFVSTVFFYTPSPKCYFFICLFTIKLYVFWKRLRLKLKMKMKDKPWINGASKQFAQNCSSSIHCRLFAKDPTKFRADGITHTVKMKLTSQNYLKRQWISNYFNQKLEISKW